MGHLYQHPGARNAWVASHLQRGLLLAQADWVSLGHPIRSEVIGEVEHFDVSEAQRGQLLICGPNIGTFVPRAAPAIDYEELSAVQLLNAAF